MLVTMAAGKPVSNQ